MNYFKIDNYYYIIPILKIENNVILNVDGKSISLYEYVNEQFPILRLMEEDRLQAFYSDNSPSRIPNHLTLRYKRKESLISKSLDYLGLPTHILAFGNGDTIVEPATKTKISCKDIYYNVLDSYRVSDCDLEKYYIKDYEEKINNFFNPSKFIKDEMNSDFCGFSEKVEQKITTNDKYISKIKIKRK